MSDVAHELLWQRIVAALRTHFPDIPEDAPPDIAVLLPDMAASEDIRRFLTRYYYPLRYGATSEALTRREGEGLVARIEQALEPRSDPVPVAEESEGRWDDLRTVAKYVVALFVAIGIGLAFGIDLKSDAIPKEWGGLLLLIAFGVLIAAKPSWRQLAVVAGLLVVMFGVPAYWENVYGEFPSLWGTRDEAGLVPKIIAALVMLAWFGGGLLSPRPRSDAVQATSDPPHGEVAGGETRPIAGLARVFFLVLGLLCLVSAGASLAGSAGRTVLPHTITIPGSSGPIFTIGPRTHTTWVTRSRRENGINFANGLLLALGGLLALNRASKRAREEEGAVDRLLDRFRFADQPRDSILPMAPALIAVAAVGWLGYLAVMKTEVHWSAEAAAPAFAAAGLSHDLYVTGNLMYGVTDDGATTHIAHFSPALMRAIDRTDIGIGAFVREFEYPMPGLLPIAFMLALCAARGVQMRRRPGGAHDPDAAPWMIVAGALNIYVLAWLVSAQRGVLFDDGVHPGWVVDLFGTLLPASILVLGAVHRKMETPAVPTVARSGWISLVHLAVLGPIAWSFWFSDAAAGSPVLMWILAYMAAACLLWCLILPDGREGRAA